MCAFFFLLTSLSVSWHNRPTLVILNFGQYELCATNSFPSRLLYVTRWFSCTNLSDRVLAIKFLLFQTGFEYPGISPIIFVYVTPVFQYTRIYFPSGESLMVDIYLLLMKALHVELFFRRQTISSIKTSAVAAKMLSPTRIILEILLFCENASWYSYVLAYIFNTACDEVW